MANQRLYSARAEGQRADERDALDPGRDNLHARNHLVPSLSTLVQKVDLCTAGSSRATAVSSARTFAETAHTEVAWASGVQLAGHVAKVLAAAAIVSRTAG